MHLSITHLYTNHVAPFCADLEHPETEPKSKIEGNKRIDKPFDTIEGHNTSEFHEKRAEFWECLAKCSINVLNSMYDGEHLRNQTTGHLDGKDTVTIRREDLNMFSNQIGDLSDDVRRLKEQSQDDGCQIQKLKEQNDRFHKALCARKEKILRLEDFLAKEKARNERASFTDESKELQVRFSFSSSVVSKALGRLIMSPYFAGCNRSTSTQYRDT